MKYALIANGDFLPMAVIEAIIGGCSIIALDGAAMRLLNRGCMPQFILGDFDSIEPDDKQRLGIKEGINTPYTGLLDITIVPCEDQSKTDLQKGVEYAKAKGATEIHLACVFSDRRVDHTLSAIRSLRFASSAQCTVWLHGLGQTLLYVKDQTIKLDGAVGDQCGIFAFPAANFSSEGLVWNGGGDEGATSLQYAFNESACNQMAYPSATITVEGEALITAPPQFAAQRHYSQLPEDELLAILYQESCLCLADGVMSSS